MYDRYGSNPLRKDFHKPKKHSKRTPANPGVVVEDVETGFVGAVLRCYKAGGMHLVELEDRHGKIRAFPLGAGFWIDGEPVELVAPISPSITKSGPPSVTGRKLTNSGSRAVADTAPRIARSSRIWVEGKHDAQLIAHVWGEDLRIEGVVVEFIEGIDKLAEKLIAFGPTSQERIGVLVDHLQWGTKEQRIAKELTRQWSSDALMILGHPFVDIWQAIKPARVGLDSWPEVPLGTDIKVGTLASLGWPHGNQADIASGWARLLRQVRDWRDLEPSLLAPMEQLIDFVTAPGTR